MILGVDSYVLNVEQNHCNKVYRVNKRTNKIRNSNIEIRNKPKGLNPNYEIRNRLVRNFAYFGHLKLFRISDFELRILFLGVLCAFARDTFFRLLLHPQNFKYLWLDFGFCNPHPSLSLKRARVKR